MGINVDQVTTALCSANQRLISPAYMRGGMGDGGGCHPRDQIALSYLSRKLDLSRDIFQDLMLTREAHAKWLCDMVLSACQESKLDPYILGTAYKKETALEIGSSALLCKNYLRCNSWDPYADHDVKPPNKAHVFLIGTNHDEFKTIKFPTGSVVIDPWRMVSDQDNVEIIRVGGNYEHKSSSG